MKEYLIIVYIVVYGIVYIALELYYRFLIPEERKKSDKVWEMPVDITLAVTALIGMILYVNHISDPWIKMLWKPVSLIIILFQIYLNLKSRIEISRSDERVIDDPNSIYVADAATIIYLIPAITLNLLFAFS
jgi:hypothetical protein